MEVETPAMVLVRGGVTPGGVGVVGRPDGSGDQRVPPSTGAAINFAADTDGSLDSAYEDNFDCGEEAMQRRLLISRILSSPLLFCASPAPPSQENQMKVPPPTTEFIDSTTKSPRMIAGSDSGAGTSSQPLASTIQTHAAPAPSEASDEDTEDANLELSRPDTEVYECSLCADDSSPVKTASRDSPIRRESEVSTVSDTAMVDSPYAPDTTSEEEEDIGDASDLARSVRSEVARVLYEMISRVSMEYESLDEDSNDCESCPEVPCESWRSRRPLSGRSVSTDSGVSSVQDDSRISLSSHLSHCSSSQSSSQSSRSSECAASPATMAAPDSSDEAAAITERTTQQRRSSRLLDLSSTLASAIAGSPAARPMVTRHSADGTTATTSSMTIRAGSVAASAKALHEAAATAVPRMTPATRLAAPVTAVNAGAAAAAAFTATFNSAAAVVVAAATIGAGGVGVCASPTVAGTAATDGVVADRQPPLKVHVTARSCATSSIVTAGTVSTTSTSATPTAVRRDGGSVTRSHTKSIINHNNNILNNNNNNNTIDNKSKNNNINNNNNNKKKNGLDAIEKALLPGLAQPKTLTVTAKGTPDPSPLQARPAAAAASFVKPSAEPQLAFPPVFLAPHPKPPLLPCRWTECGFSARKDFELADHIADAHVAAQGDKGPFVCLWEACKVFNVPSTLKHWLEQHVVKHSRSKPLKCIVDGCPQRFSTKALLEAHVNSHFEKNPKLKNEASLKSQNQLLKLAKRKRLLRQHSKMQAGRKYDFFDACVMHQIKESLLQFAELEQSSSSTNAHHSSQSSIYPAVLTSPAITASPDASSVAAAASSSSTSVGDGATVSRNSHPGRKRSTTASSVNTPLYPSPSATDPAITAPATTHWPRRSSRRKVALTSELTVQAQTTQVQAESSSMLSRNCSEPVVILGPRCTVNLPGQSRGHHGSVPSPDSGFDTSDPSPSPPQLDEIASGAAGFSAALANAAAAGRLLMPSQHSAMMAFKSHQPPSLPTHQSGSINASVQRAATATPAAYKLDPATAALVPFLGSMTSKRSFARRRGAISAGGVTDTIGLGGRGATVCTRSRISLLSSSMSSSSSSSSASALTASSPGSTSSLAANDGVATPLIESLARAVRTTRSGQRQMLISFYRPRRAATVEAAAER